MDNRFYLYYLKGYLNEYINNQELLKYQKYVGSFRSYKLNLAFRYLGLKQINVENPLLFIFLGICDIIVSCLMSFVKFIRVLIQWLKVPHKILPKDKILMLGIAPFTTYTKGVLDKEFKSMVTYLHVPFTLKEMGNDNLNILSSLSFCDLLSALVASWRLDFFIAIKYLNRDFLFRAHTSYEYFLTCLFIEKVESFNNTFISCEIINRWAFLMLNLSAPTIFVQHGKTQCIHYIKVGTPNIAYFMNEEQKIVHNEYIFKQKVQDSRVLKVFEYSGNECLLNNGKKNVLMVCNTLFIGMERKILELLSEVDINLYLKTHPLTKTLDGYESMKEIRPFSYVPSGMYPKVDCVISYESTLAEEYESVGTFVIWYDRLNNINELKYLINNL